METDRNDPLLLENQLCFPLYACAREIVKRYKPHLDDIGLTYTQYVTMMVLWEEGETTSKAIGCRLHLDSGTLTPVLKKLDEKGLVTRRRSETDERNLVVTITGAGRALKARAARIPERMGECVALTPEESGALYALLYKLLGALN